MIRSAAAGRFPFNPLIGAQGAVGIDMMPIAAFVAKAKGEWDANPSTLLLPQEGSLKTNPPTIQKPFLK